MKKVLRILGGICLPIGLYIVFSTGLENFNLFEWKNIELGMYCLVTIIFLVSYLLATHPVNEDKENEEFEDYYKKRFGNIE